MAKLYLASLALVLLFACLHRAGAQIGVSYGLNGDNLPSPREVISLYNQANFKRMRIYNANQDVLHALSGTPIELMIDVPTADLQRIAASQENANAWVNTNVKSYPGVNFKYINVGNEVDASPQFGQFLLPALQNIHNAVSAAGLGAKIKVSTAISEGALATSYPPSAGSFKPELLSFIDPLIKFLASTNAPLMLNVYPYFAYADNQKDISLDYALFRSTQVVVQDGPLGYKALFDAQVDAMYSAMQKSGGGNLEIVVSETGWPSAGNGDITTLDNERTYVTNLIRHASGGTPKRPGKAIEYYLFAMFDEDQKTPEYEKHWGLFLPNKQPKFPLN